MVAVPPVTGAVPISVKSPEPEVPAGQASENSLLASVSNSPLTESWATR